MHPAKKFFYVCAGLFLLAASYQLGVRTAGAQSGSSVTGFTALSGNSFFVMTPTGDIYGRELYSYTQEPLRYMGNFWSGGGPVNVQRGTLGQLKARFRDTAPQGK